MFIACKSQIYLVQKYLVGFFILPVKGEKKHFKPCHSYGKMNVDKNLDLTKMRKPYNCANFSTNLEFKEPAGLFKNWFDLANHTPEIMEANAMVVATSNKSGAPSARYVLLKVFDKGGFIFFTNYESRKGLEIEENPNVALLFYWDALHRQVRIEGKAEKLSQEENNRYFYTRPLESQISAAVSSQSQPIESWECLQAKHDRFKVEYQGKEIPRPENWGGFRVVPNTYEFWQGQSNRLHHRLVFTKKNEELSHKGDDGWFYKILAP